MRTMNTLYLMERGLRVNVSKGALEVRRERRLVARFPIEGLEGVVLGGAVEITTVAISRCVARGVRVSQVGGAGKLKFAVSGPTRGNVMLRLAQLRAFDDAPIALGIARSFVGGKLQNQRRLLQRWAWDSSGTARAILEQERARVEGLLGMVSDARDGDHLRGIEGSATRSYFKGVGAHLHRVAPDLTFTVRSRRPPLDPVNAALSYGYGLGVAEATGALDAVGLDPQIGYLHLLRPGRQSLALDLVEELRPLVDRFVVRLMGRRILRLEHFQTMPNGSCRLTEDGRRLFLERYEEARSVEVIHPFLRRPIAVAIIPAVQATILARTIRGDSPSYVPFLMEP